MAQSTKTENEMIQDLPELTRNRQLFLLNAYSNAFKLPANITHWEQVMCAGYNPYYQRLEAVVNVKQATGYNGTLCSRGSQEYVRFFVDFKDGFGFRNMGYRNFKVADIPDNPPGPQHPLSYLAYLFIDDATHRRFLACDKAVIPTLRVVLSWNSIPSLNPNTMPHYGNRIDADIQLARKKFIWWKDIVEIGKLKDVAKLVDQEFELPLKNETPADAGEILKLNQAAGVADFRTFYSTIGVKLNSTADFSKAASVFEVQNLDELNIDFNNFLDLFNGAGKKADVNFEELTCVGLNPLTNRLGAVIHVKKSNGYNGNLCTNGSVEHVAFWADWNNNGTYDQYLGTAAVRVHDISNIPKGGLFYTVQLPLDVTNRLRLCSNPNVIRIRAVLSWESLPSTTDPNVLNHWGNYKDALVQLRPVSKSDSLIHAAIHYVGNVDRTMIDVTSALYNSGVSSPNHNRPWGGVISFKGVIDRNGFNGTIKYRLLVKKQGDPDSAYQPVSLTETFRLDYLGDSAGPYDDKQITSDGWYEYKQNPAPGIEIFNIDGLLAQWNSTSVPDGTYSIRFIFTDEFNNILVGDQFNIRVCNTIMSVSTTANTVVDTSKDLDLVIDGGDCHSYTPGEPTISGHVRALHPYFAWWTLELQPATHTHGVVAVPASRTVSGIADTGDANAAWSLDTSALDPCGYTMSLLSHSRVILNSNPGNFPQYGPKAVGFAKLP